MDNVCTTLLPLHCGQSVQALICIIWRSRAHFEAWPTRGLGRRTHVWLHHIWLHHDTGVLTCDNTAMQVHLCVITPWCSLQRMPNSSLLHAAAQVSSHVQKEASYTQSKSVLSNVSVGTENYIYVNYICKLTPLNPICIFHVKSLMPAPL